MQRLALIRAAAETLACWLDRVLRWLQYAMFGSVFVSVLAFHEYSHTLHGAGAHAAHHPFLLGLALAVLWVAIGSILLGWMYSFDQRRLEFRALAEALRVRCWWAFAGIGRSTANSYLGQLRGETAWARRALLAVAPPADQWRIAFQQGNQATQLGHLRQTLQEWVVDQRKYYEDRGHEHDRSAHRCRILGLLAAAAGWASAVFLLLDGPVHPTHEVVSIASTLLLIGGLLIAWCERQAHEEQSRQYGRMAVVFAQGVKDLETSLSGSGDIDRSQEVLVRLGLEALTEHAQWLILKRARPFELLIH